jgi:putative DNA primase/helicase
VVPVKVGGQISTLELIDESGCKSAISGGQKSGGHWSAQPLPDGDGAGITLLIGEGVATCLSAQQATGYVAVAALYSGNLLAVAREMRERFPKAVLVILADLVKAAGDPDPHAIEAARTVGGRLVIPDFGEDRPSGMTDFNDLHQLQGLEAVAECIRRQMAAFSSAQDGTPPGSEDVPRSDSQHKEGPRKARDGQGEAPGSSKAWGGGQTRPDTGTAPGNAESLRRLLRS